jgi:hypothetical protein
MASPAIAHYGTTIIEAAAPAGVDQRTIPHTGSLAGTLRLLELYGFEPLIENMYDGVGRQYIRSRGKITDPDYIEFDAFTSYRAVVRPPTATPRIGDTIFRLTHQRPVDVYRQAATLGLLAPANRLANANAFLHGDSPWLLARGPNGQLFELGATQGTRRDNNVVYIWTAPEELEQTSREFCTQFGMEEAGAAPFHDVGQVRLLQRQRPGMSIGLLTPLPGEQVAPRWSDDIFVEAGYSHYRMGSPDKRKTLAASRQAFPDGGDVSFVYFRDSYLELVQVLEDDPTLAG